MKKLNEREKEERVIKKILKRIKSIERQYGVEVTRRGCYRYHTQKSEEKRIKKEIKEKKGELEELNKKVKR